MNMNTNVPTNGARNSLVKSRSTKFMIRYICQLQLGSHRVAAVQYTFTHKQYTEQHKNKQYIEQHKNKQYIEQHKNTAGLVRAVPHLWGFYPGICLTTEEKARKDLSQGSRRVPAGTMKIHTHTIGMRRHDNKNT
jgi:hypothetical protein